MFNPAFQCSQCLKFCHKQCCETADSICPCTGKPESTVNQEQLFAAFPVNRSITESTVHFYDEFVKPTFMKKEGNDTNAQSDAAQSFRNRRTYKEEISDSDSECSASTISRTTTFQSLGSADEASQIDISNVQMTPSLVIPHRHSSFSGSEDDILSTPGFLTVIIQQATDLEMPPVRSLFPVHV